jgi:hypothetical protein
MVREEWGMDLGGLGKGDGMMGSQEEEEEERRRTEWGAERVLGLREEIRAIVQAVGTAVGVAVIVVVVVSVGGGQIRDKLLFAFVLGWSSEEACVVGWIHW